MLDTGIHPHDDLTTPENRIIAFHDVINGETEPYDDNGHGTHCAGDAAGNGAMSDGEYKGPAPEASIVGVKVLNSSGGDKLFNIIEGIEWCMENKEEYGIQILSLSLGSEAYESFRRDPLSLAAQEAWQAGMIVCAGVIALMLEANPDLSPNDVKSILQMTGDPAFGSGWGYIDAGRAVEMAIRQRENRQTSPSADGQ